MPLACILHVPIFDFQSLARGGLRILGLRVCCCAALLSHASCHSSVGIADTSAGLKSLHIVFSKVVMALECAIAYVVVDASTIECGHTTLGRARVIIFDESVVETLGIELLAVSGTCVVATDAR